jgi:hypothetical protein
MTKKELLAKATRTEDFNSNNDWGFGGSIGTAYFFENEIKLVLRKLCYRHAPSDNVHEVYQNGIIIIDGYSFGKNAISQVEKLIS